MVVEGADRKRYVLINERLWTTGPDGTVINDVTNQYKGKNLDPIILASILRNLGREMTLSNWYWRAAHYLAERLDIRLKDIPVYTEALEHED